MKKLIAFTLAMLLCQSVGVFASGKYDSYVKDGADASKCVSCGLCEKQCPQAVPIRQWLQTVHKEATENK